MGPFVVGAWQRWRKPGFQSEYQMGLNKAIQVMLLRWILFFLLICSLHWENWSPIEQSFAAEPNLSATLQAKYTELDKPLRNNQFQRALYLGSEETSQDLKGEVYAVIDYPFATVNMALNEPAHWCDVLILHVYIKYCHASSNMAGTALTVNLSNKYDQALADTYRAEFNYRPLIKTPDYFAVGLDAENGPLGTHDYHIRIEAIPLENGQTFLHFTYAYAFGMISRATMQGYLATIGRNKVGFTVMGKQPNGQPVFIQGERGVVERNTMRYFLAIDAYLAALTAPPEDQLEKRLQLWYDGTDRYARQLHEIERQNYLEMKRKEYQRQQLN